MGSKHDVLGVLVLALLLGLLLMAGPASAGPPPPGSQWGGHEVNGSAYIVNADRYVTLQVVADDQRVSGTMDVSVKRRWYDADGTGHQSGTFSLYNAAGSWYCPYWETVYFFNASSAEDPVQELLLNCTAKGAGAYKGLVFVHSHHGAQGGPFILKGWILPAD
jgi:hypothetical protein